MELTWLYTALALLIGALIFLLKSKKEPEQHQNQNQPRPVQAGPGGRRQPRRLRANRDENRVEDLPVGDDDDEDAEPNAPTVSRFDADGKKIGAKKAKKLEEKENRRIQREMMEREREEEKQRKEERDQLRFVLNYYTQS